MEKNNALLSTLLRPNCHNGRYNEGSDFIYAHTFPIAKHPPQSLHLICNFLPLRR